MGSTIILFVAVNIEWQVPRRVAYPLAVIDLTRERYSFIAGRALSAHTVTEINGRIYRLTERCRASEKSLRPVSFDVDLGALPWYGFDQIDAFSTLYKEEHERRGLFDSDGAQS